MDLAFSPEDIAFRDEVRAFIADAYDDDMRARMAQSKNGGIGREAIMRWHKRLAEKGWLAANWPEEHGGPGWNAAQRFIFDMEMAAAGAPSTSNMGLKMCAPVIMAFGSDEQKERFLPAIRNADVWWCQGYSEPGSGSDLASLSMKAENKGDHYLLNGSKIWTTYAQHADWIFCLVRTDPNPPKRQLGISFILVDMRSEGIEVVPLPTLDVAPDGEQEVNQVFFTDVKVPMENRIGEEGQGWTYAKYLLEFERGSAYASGLKESLNRVREIAGVEVDGHGGALINDLDFRRKVDELEMQIEALNFTELRIFSALASGQRPGPESSMLKCAGSEAQQAVTELALEAAGGYSQPFVLDTFAELEGRTNEPRPGPDYAAPIAPRYLNVRKTSIYAGSNEIQRNIMAKLVLGL